MQCSAASDPWLPKWHHILSEMACHSPLYTLATRAVRAVSKPPVYNLYPNLCLTRGNPLHHSPALPAVVASSSITLATLKTLYLKSFQVVEYCNQGIT